MSDEMTNDDLDIDLEIKPSSPLGPVSVSDGNEPMYPHFSLHLPKEAADVPVPKKGYVRFEYELQSSTTQKDGDAIHEMKFVELCEVSPMDDAEETAEGETPEGEADAETSEPDVNETAGNAMDRMAKAKMAKKSANSEY